MPRLGRPALGKIGVQAYSVRKEIRPSPRRTGVGPVCVRRLARYINVRPRIFVNVARNWANSSPVVRARLKAVSACGLRNLIRPSSGRCQKTHGKLATVLVNFLRSSRRFSVVLYELMKGAQLCSYAGVPAPLVAKQAKLAMPLRGSWKPKSTENVYIA